MKEEQRNTLVHAINHFGVEGQINKAMEKMRELITELSQRNLARFDKDRVAEEVADALIMLEQLRIIFGASKVDGYIAGKLERLERTINGDWRRQERMMPKGMVKHREESEARKGSLVVGEGSRPHGCPGRENPCPACGPERSAVLFVLSAFCAVANLRILWPLLRPYRAGDHRKTKSDMLRTV